MANENIDKLYQILDAFERAGKDKKEIEKARDLLDDGNLGKALEIIRKLNNSSKTGSKDKKTEQKNQENKAKKEETKKNILMKRKLMRMSLMAMKMSMSKRIMRKNLIMTMTM